MKRVNYDGRVARLREKYAMHLKNCVDDGTLDCAPGWFDLIEDTLRRMVEISENNQKPFEVRQIKDKFGALRIYASSLGKITLEAEKKSLEICMFCGAHASRVSIGGWYSTLCPKCHTLCRNGASLDSDWDQLTMPEKLH